MYKEICITTQKSFIENHTLAGIVVAPRDKNMGKIAYKLNNKMIKK